MRNNSGLRFEREIINAAKVYDAHVYKIPTTKYSTFGTAGIYDIAITYKSISYGIECKVISELASFPFNRVEPQQIESLKTLHNNGGRSFILLNIRVRPTQYLISISIKEFLELKNSMTRKSIPKEDLLKMKQITRTRNPSYWELTSLFNQNYDKTII